MKKSLFLEEELLLRELFLEKRKNYFDKEYFFMPFIPFYVASLSSSPYLVRSSKSFAGTV